MRWSYKTAHFSLKKEGLLGSAFLDEEEIEISLNEFGKVGWELVSFMEVSDGVVAVFKQPMGLAVTTAPLAVEKMEEDIDEEPVAIETPKTQLVEENAPENNDEDVGAIKIM